MDPQHNDEWNDHHGDDGVGWNDQLNAMEERGVIDGENAVKWWEQDAIGSRANGDTRAVAERVSRGLDDGDPMILDALPTPTGNPAEWYGDAAGTDDWVEWHTLRTADQDQLIDRYRQAFNDSVHDGVANACHDHLKKEDEQ